MNIFHIPKKANFKLHFLIFKIYNIILFINSQSNRLIFIGRILTLYRHYNFFRNVYIYIYIKIYNIILIIDKLMYD